MKHHHVFAAFALSMAAVVASPAQAQSSQKVELFGTAVQNADRSALRDTLKKNGVKAVRVKDEFFYDQYDAAGLLEGASTLEVGYVTATNKFATFVYTFPAHVNTHKVVEVVDLVKAKYGKPSSVNGNYGLGEVTAKWNLKDNMEIIVERGWPNTTTYLSIRDRVAFAKMNAEIKSIEESETKQKTKAQSKAF